MRAGGDRAAARTYALPSVHARRPIHVLRTIAMVLFGVFDIATLTLIQVSYDCQLLGSSANVRGTVYAFPGKGEAPARGCCLSVPHALLCDPSSVC